MGRDAGIANRLRAAGLRVVEVAGWQTAGSESFAPGGSVNHHTAGPSSGSTPSLLTCIEGRPDLAGPLCNVYQSREPSEDIAYVIAAGRANHAGEGSWRGLSGNASVYGLEIEHDGTTALPERRIALAARIHAAMFTGDPANVCQHREWTSRKIDVATNVPGDDFRARVAAARQPAAPLPMEDDDVYLVANPAGQYHTCEGGKLVAVAGPSDLEKYQKAGIRNVGKVSDNQWGVLTRAYERVT